MPFVYILRCRDRTLYTGIAKDVDARFDVHQQGKGARYTRSRLPVALVFKRRVAGWGDALREEHKIKRLSRSEKEALVTEAQRRRRKAAGAVPSRPPRRSP
jgi:predicted GIY-YIG superfamily endonuclease